MPGQEVTNGPAAPGATSCGSGVITSTAVDSRLAVLAGRLAALADPMRLRIVTLLAEGGRCMCDLHVQVPVAANLISYHLRVLRDAGLVPRSATPRSGRSPP
jgi:ArsR family transcriptional regulator, arsenate/arsenite/antimonite-responsive transcriptional repressor